MTTSNKCQGTIHTMRCSPEQPSPELQALIDKANDQRSLWAKTADFFSGAWDGTKRIAEASWNDPGSTAVGVAKGVGNLPTDVWNLLVLGSKYSGPIPPALQADTLNYAAMQSYQRGDIATANAMAGRASQMMQAGYASDFFELKGDAEKGGGVLSMLVPVGAIAKGAGAAAKAVRGVKTLDAAADVAKVGKAADGAADVAKVGQEVSGTGKAEAKASDGLAVEAKPKPKPKPKPYADPKSRPKYAEGQVDEVWERSRSPDGKVYDPNTGQELTWDKARSRAGQWDMGHLPGEEYRKLHSRYMSGEIDLKQFLSEYKNPANYRPESISGNRGHAFEMP